MKELQQMQGDSLERAVLGHILELGVKICFYLDC